MRGARMFPKQLTLASSVFVVAIVAFANADEPAEKPKGKGWPVYAVAGRIVAFPPGVEEPPIVYKGAIGQKPLALIKVDGKVVGEVYGAALKGTPADEAKDMAGSADGNEKMKLLKQETAKQKDETMEVVTLRVDLKSNLGQPWIIHSLYFPRKEGASTFKLVVSEAKFEDVQATFETMLFFADKFPAKKAEKP